MPLFDRKDKSRYATFSRRTLLAAGGMTGIFAVLAGRLYQLQILDFDQFMTEAEENRINERLLAPARGRILDRFAVELANDRRNYRVLLTAEQATGGISESLDAIGRLIEISDARRKKILREIAQNKPFVPIAVVENLNWEAFSRLSLNLPYLPGVQLDVGETRAYPFADELSHIVGYVAAVSEEDRKNGNDPLLSLPDFRVGKRGIEKEFDEEIRGQAGVSRVEVNAYGRVIRELSRDPGIPGQDVYLTIDQDVQKFAAERLGGESAACAVMDVETGDVIALVSSPGFDPNLFNVGISTAEWNALTDNDHKPLLNKVLSGTYPPGSTFKPVTALAALDAGVAVPGYTVFCSGVYTFGNHQFHCWKRGGHGTLDLRGALKHSCDVFFYETARRVGIDKLEQTAHALGLGKVTGIELPGERAGVIPGREWKRKTLHAAWQQGETLIAGIGQGYVLLTPLQLCMLTARIASGRAVSPRLVHSVGAHARPHRAAPRLPFSDDALAAVRSGMDGVTNEPGGTAYAWRINEAGFEMAGKTGTAQVRRITKAERATGVMKNEHLPWRLRDHALFIAYAPVEKPRYACAILVEHGAVAAHPQVQMARDILLYTQKKDPLRIPPAYPVTAAANTTGRG